MTIGMLPVAKKRPVDDTSSGGVRKSRDPEPRPIALTIRGRDEWKEWVKRLAAADRASLNELVDRSLARYAREVGFKEMPPER